MYAEVGSLCEGCGNIVLATINLFNTSCSKVLLFEGSSAVLVCPRPRSTGGGFSGFSPPGVPVAPQRFKELWRG